jgi:transcriptional regulator GlxA family with amidase domain
MLNKLTREPNRRKTFSRQWYRYAGDPRIRKLIHEIQANRDCRVVQIAKRLNLSTSRLMHLFRTETGMSLGSFIRRERLQRAADLLVCTDDKIETIGYSIGFRHVSSFSRAFSSRYSRSPASYRRQAKNGLLKDTLRRGVGSSIGRGEEAMFTRFQEKSDRWSKPWTK